jgi:hypothetical protein
MQGTIKELRERVEELEAEREWLLSRLDRFENAIIEAVDFGDSQALKRVLVKE